MIPSAHIFQRIVSDQSRHPILENNLRGVFAEYLVADLLGEGWSVKRGSWNSWDIDGPEGQRIEVKASARIQTWTEEYLKKSGYKPIPPSFDIAERKYNYLGAKAASPVREANAYVFALHDEARIALADQRRAEQWMFYVLPTSILPIGQKRIGLSALGKLTTPVPSSALRDAVLQVVEHFK